MGIIKKEITQEKVNIREEIDRETRIKTHNPKTWVQKLLFWQKDDAHLKEAIHPEEEYTNLYGGLPGEQKMTQ